MSPLPTTSHPWVNDPLKDINHNPSVYIIIHGFSVLVINHTYYLYTYILYWYWYWYILTIDINQSSITHPTPGYSLWPPSLRGQSPGDRFAAAKPLAAVDFCAFDSDFNVSWRARWWCPVENVVPNWWLWRAYKWLRMIDKVENWCGLYWLVGGLFEFIDGLYTG